jgi:hypothetical protein
MISRQGLITELLENERRKIFESSYEWIDDYKKNLTPEQIQIKDRYETLGRMVSDNGMINMTDILIPKENKDRKVYVGTFATDEPELISECKNSKYNAYYINFKVADCDGDYIDKRLLKLSYKAWFDWFFYLRYIEEKERRFINNLSVFLRVITYNGEITSMSWYKYYKPECYKK